MEETPSSPSTPAPRFVFEACLRWQLPLSLFIIGVVGAGRFVFLNDSKARWLIVNLGYWMIAGTTVLYGWFLWKRLRAVGWSKTDWRPHRLGLVCIAVCALFLQVHEERGYKILFDEFAIVGVARNMHFDREATYPTCAHYFNGRLLIRNGNIDKRPFFFAFLLSLVHDLTGYREANAFYLNGVLAAVLLALIYLIGSRLGGARIGCLGVFLFTGLPLLAQNATGGGFEIINLVMICALFLTAIEYLQSPVEQGLDLFIMTAVLLAQARYESLLYAVIVPSVVLWKWLRTRQLKLTCFAVISPLFMSTPLILNKVFLDSPAFFQTKPGESAFAWSHLSDNLAHAIFYLFNPSLSASSSLLLSAAGIIALFFLMLLLVRNSLKRNLDKIDIVLGFITLVILTNLTVTLCYFWGHWDDPMASRFSFTLQLLFVLAIMRVTVEFLGRRPLPWFGLFIAGGWLVLVTASADSRHYDSTGNVTSREYAWYHDYLAKKSPWETLSITSSSLGPILQGYPAIPFGVAQLEKWRVKACLNGEFYREVIVFQRFKIDSKTGKWVESGSSQLGDDFMLETLAERRFRPNYISRISRLVDVKGDLKPPPDFEKEKPPFKDDDALVLHMLSKLP